ncbi:MAG TPA: cobalamin-binding protein [Parasegetibacter sp.]
MDKSARGIGYFYSMNSIDFFPERIVCLTEETTETLYLLGEQDRIVGISGFTVRPARARKEKPVVSAFIDARIEKIISLQPDLVIGYSDLQADIAKQLIAHGITVWINTHHSVEGIFKMMVQLGSLVGQQEKAIALVNRIRTDLAQITEISETNNRKPRIYFEEWFDPLISGIHWVSEIIELAGGTDIFRENRASFLAKNRIIADPQEVVNRNPDIILASWCGKKFKKDRLLARKNWEKINAVKTDQIFEIKSSVILQPGPAAVTDGIKEIAKIIEDWQAYDQ